MGEDNRTKMKKKNGLHLEFHGDFGKVDRRKIPSGAVVGLNIAQVPGGPKSKEEIKKRLEKAGATSVSFIRAINPAEEQQREIREQEARNALMPKPNRRRALPAKKVGLGLS